MIVYLAMVSALKALQDKICGLESERNLAAERFQYLFQETDKEQTPSLECSDTTANSSAAGYSVSSDVTSNKHG